MSDWALFFGSMVVAIVSSAMIYQRGKQVGFDLAEQNLEQEGLVAIEDVSFALVDEGVEDSLAQRVMRRLMGAPEEELADASV